MIAFSISPPKHPDTVGPMPVATAPANPRDADLFRQMLSVLIAPMEEASTVDTAEIDAESIAKDPETTLLPPATPIQQPPRFPLEISSAMGELRLTQSGDAETTIRGSDRIADSAADSAQGMRLAVATPPRRTMHPSLPDNPPFKLPETGDNFESPPENAPRDDRKTDAKVTLPIPPAPRRAPIGGHTPHPDPVLLAPEDTDIVPQNGIRTPVAPRINPHQLPDQRVLPVAVIANPARTGAPPVFWGKDTRHDAGPELGKWMSIPDISFNLLAAISSAAGAQVSNIHNLAASVTVQIVTQVTTSPLSGVIELRLTPTELGPVRIIMQANDGGTTIAIFADNPQTLDLMRRNSDMLLQEFRSLGHSNIAFQFGPGGQGHGHHTPESRITHAAFEVEPAHTNPMPCAVKADGLDLRL